MKNKWKLYLGFILLISMLILAACGSSEEANSETNGEGSSGEAEKKLVLQVGTDAAFAPFEYMDKGEIVGFDVDLLAAVMEEAGYEYELKNVGWDPLFASLQGKDLDIGVAGITINAERKQTFDFSLPYFESTHMIVFNAGDDISSAKDLKELKIGVQNGTTGQTAAEKVVGENADNMLKYETTAVAFMALANGDVDAVVTDNVVANEYVKNNPDANVETITDKENFEAEFYGWMFPKDSKIKADLDEALTAVIENGKYQEIYKEWFGVEADTDALLEAATD
ncbi:basic amino acid ABC transporter substrate-binding protein [Radiobacillus kanasensis]|uniref:basic amino acid ABC transporter substrate-binding protein n=1 Tax=Radiobacillus kanasensis TaxID=2844358 RepID=UPI001E48CBE8|nr:basic amino acid ABC transporter substrate-binding protein [Radiobacillus kanasensis]UFT99144.1 basic amino acid ABC transporter substrate-binding protein [Radiobacillus kanasensis]